MKKPLFGALMALLLLGLHVWAGGDNYTQDFADQHGCNLAGYNGAECVANCKGLARWWVSEPYISLWMEDQPMSSQPSRGPQIALHLSYKQRDTRSNNANLFGVGPNWEISFLSYITANFTGCGYGTNTLHDTYRWATYTANVYLAGGGVQSFVNTDQQANPLLASPNFYSQTRLVPSFDTDIQPKGFDLIYPDGSKDVYAYVQGSYPNQTMYLSGRYDATGAGYTFNYQTVSGVLKLTHLIDVDGRTNTLSYANSTFPNLVTEVRDHYGRTTTLLYSSTGQLTNIIDPETLYSRFVYDSQGVITNLTTPYGTTTFKVSGGNGAFMTGETVNRSIEVTMPNNERHLYVYRDGCTGFIPASSSQVPTGLPAGVILSANDMSWRNSFYWGPQQYACLSTTNPASFTAQDYLMARMRNWLRQANGSSNMLSMALSSERSPSPDGTSEGQRTFYSYPGKPSADYEGSSGVPDYVGQLLPGNGTHFVRHQRDSSGNSTNIIENTESGQRIWRRIYSTNGVDLEALYGPDNNLVAGYRYNAFHQITHMTNAIGLTTYYYDNLNRLVGTVAPNGLQITNIYNPSGEWTGYLFQRRMLAPENVLLEEFDYNKGVVSEIVDARGLQLSLQHDSLHRVTNITHSAGGITLATEARLYNKLDLVGSQDRLQKWTQYHYDELGRMVTITNALTNVTSFEYCSCGSLDSIVDALLRPTLFTRDYAGRLKTNQIGSELTRYGYDRAGRLSYATNASSQVTSYSYTLSGQVSTVANAAGTVSSVVYDAYDRPWKVTDANNCTVTNIYDCLGRIQSRTWPGGAKETWVYTDNIVAATSYTNRLGECTQFEYDMAGRLKTLVSPGNFTNSYTYYPAGDIHTFTDGRGNTTTWEYNAYGQPTSRSKGANCITSWAYNANGWLTNEVTQGAGTATKRKSYTYDDVGNLKSISYPGTTTAGVTFEYNAVNELTSMVDSLGVTSFAYQQTGELMLEDGPWANDEVGMSFLAGQRTSLTLGMPLGGAWAWVNTYDAAGALRTSSTPAGVFSMEYKDPAGALVRTLTMPVGANAEWRYVTNSFDAFGALTNTILRTSAGTMLDSYAYGVSNGLRVVKQTRRVGDFVNYTYDTAGRLKTASAKEAGGSTNRLHEQFSYDYDPAGNITNRTRNGLTTVFSIDALNRLFSASRSGSITVSGSGYGYEGYVNGASVQHSGGTSTGFVYVDKTYAVPNIPLAYAGSMACSVSIKNYDESITKQVSTPTSTGITFAYDPYGNLSGDGQRQFEYDAENRLTRVSGTGWSTYWFYDGLGRMRVRREVTSTSTNDYHYIYDGRAILQERDAKNLPTWTVSRGPTGLLALSRHRRSYADHAYYYTDAHGNVVALVNDYQNVVARYLYDPYGNQVAISGPWADANPFRFSSQYYHAPSGLHAYACRFYDPGLQRWLTPDPLGEAADSNLYRFVGNDPVNFVDDDGMQARPARQMEFEFRPPPPRRWGSGQMPQEEIVRARDNLLSRGGLANAQIGPTQLELPLRGAGAECSSGTIYSSAPPETRGETPVMDRLAREAAKGGIGPVLKGQEGVARAIAEYAASGGKVLGEQISIRAGGGRTIPDFYGQNAQGIREFIEVKNGLGAALNANQQRLYPIIQQSGGVPVGMNAKIPGVMTPGVPIPPTPVRLIQYP